MSVMLYPSILCVAPLIDLFGLCVACLTVFVNCLVTKLTMYLSVVVILLLNVMEVFSVDGGALCCVPSVHLSVTVIVFLIGRIFIYRGKA